MKFDLPALIQPMPTTAQKVFSGVVFDVYQWQQQQFDGSYRTFEKLQRLDSAEVIPITSDHKILIVEQSQPGHESYYAFIGGAKDHQQEDILVCAQRELQEESGYRAQDWQLLEVHQEMVKLESYKYTFIAKNLEKISEPKLEAGEKIKIIAVSFDELFELLTTGGLQYEFRIANLFLKAKLDKDKYQQLANLFY